MLELGKALKEMGAITGLQFAATSQTEPVIHLGDGIEQEAQTLGGSIACRAKAWIPLMNVRVLGLANDFARFFQNELRLLLGAGSLEKPYRFGEFPRRKRMFSGTLHGCVLVAARQLGHVPGLCG